MVTVEISMLGKRPTRRTKRPVPYLSTMLPMQRAALPMPQRTQIKRPKINGHDAYEMEELWFGS